MVPVLSWHPALVRQRGFPRSFAWFTTEDRGVPADAVPNTKRFEGLLRLGDMCALEPAQVPPGMLHTHQICSTPHAEPGGEQGCNVSLGIRKGSEKQMGFVHALGVKERLCHFDINICVELSEGFFHFIGLTS